MLETLRTKIYADGADLGSLLDLAELPYIRGFTTNPTLLRNAGVTDYQGFARAVLSEITDRPISFEVFADDAAGILSQAREIAGWGPNVYVKIPVTTTSGSSLADVVRELTLDGVQVNVTAIMTLAQLEETALALDGGVAANVSVFAGRIADTGRDPIPHVRAAIDAVRSQPNVEVIWASPREVLNVIQASEIGCHIITVTYDLLKKLETLGRDLTDFSLDTVRMFHRDAAAAGLSVGALRS
jgi:transaldolase